MRYKNANAVLPEGLVRELQEYIQGGYLYVPVDRSRQKRWGEVSGYRKELQQRNDKIKKEYRGGSAIEVLADRYGLSVYAIRKILYQK